MAGLVPGMTTFNHRAKAAPRILSTALAEDRGSDPDERRARRDRLLEVSAHARGDLDGPGMVGAHPLGCELSPRTFMNAVPRRSVPSIFSGGDTKLVPA